MTKPKILLYDIETTPNISATWPGMYEVNVAKIIKPGEMACFAYKWYGEKKVTCVTRQGQKTDKELIKKLCKLMNEAHIVVAHNGISFDNKTSNTRIAKNKLSRPNHFQNVDTLKVCRKNFKLNSYKMGDVLEFFNLSEKKLPSPGIDTWLGCMENNSKSWKKMIKYNKQDIKGLNALYKFLLPWIDNHPNVSFIKGKEYGCPNCGNDTLKSEGVRYANNSAYRRYKCLDCGKPCRERVSIKKLKKSKIV